MQTKTFTNVLSDSEFGLGNTASTIYATAHGGNSPGFDTSFNSANGGAGRNNFDGTNYAFARYFFHFDTSHLGNVKIDSAFLRLPGTNTSNNNVDTDTIAIYQSTVSTDTSISTGDWLNWGSTLLGSLAMGSYNNAGNNDIALNASGIALVNPKGYTKIMVMSLKDHAATPPTGKNNQTFTTTGLILSVNYSPAFGGGMI